MEAMKFHYAQSANIDENSYENEESEDSSDLSESETVFVALSQHDIRSLDDQENQLENNYELIIKEI
ncbi:3113_t:CDS:2 [Ambispora gerdemannii]|uniref:3113_t:CDS:1 n=1 Tax=Ambispora gerdemannii TaxID=144530 RepID=A0A9N9H673_9GLOM|nr:3113_t:CDS:2 [Ambispora gerdemannii]